MAPTRPRTSRTLRQLLLSARAAMAARAAVAAALAWGVALLAPGSAAEYPYYGPLGAVIATSATIVGSLRESTQAVAAIALGSALGLAAQWSGAPAFAAVPLVVLVGVLAGGLRVLGGAASWVATSALFVIVLSERDAPGFVGAYAGLTLMGAAIGVAVNVACGPLLIATIGDAHDVVRRALADQLELLAGGLADGDLPDPSRWQWLSREISPYVAQLRADAHTTDEALRINPHARRRRAQADRTRAESQRLADLTWHVETLRGHLVGHEHAELEEVTLGPTLRPPTARLLRTVAAALSEERGADEVDERLAELRAAVRDAPGDTFHAAAVVTMLDEIRARL